VSQLGLAIAILEGISRLITDSTPAARWIHAPSNRSYNTDFQATRPKVPGKDDVTGEPLTKRPDDTAVRSRVLHPSLPSAPIRPPPSSVR
jgi:hypothetical protein